MMQLAPYLFFNGNCEDALAFYATALHGKVTALNRFDEAPGAENMPEQQRKRVMHATFSAPGVSLMASDVDAAQGEGEMSRVSLSIATSDVDEGARVFDALANGGSVTMPYAKQFWGASFGTLVDRFGIRWMVNAG